jgi:sulfite reductase (NADPH) flavoprotein alpha-component
MGQFGGHILRRFIGSRWVKNENNKLCIDCHGDIKKMREIKIQDIDIKTGIKSKQNHPPSERFIHAVETYNKTLHGRLLIAGSEYGASCLDCHAPSGWKHKIGHYEHPKAATYKDELKNTCGQSDCHGYAKKPGNEGFVTTDMHDMSMINVVNIEQLWKHELLQKSAWFWGLWPFLLGGLVFILGSLIWWLFYRHDKKIIPLFGGDRFETVMIGRKAKKNRVRTKSPAPKIKAEPQSKTISEAKDKNPSPVTKIADEVDVTKKTNDKEKGE